MSLAVRKNENIKKSLEDLFIEINFIPSKVVFIKPNLCAREPVLPGENSSLKVADSLVEILLDRGAEKIIFGHGALLGTSDHSCSFDDMLRSSGFIKFRDIAKVEIVNLDKLPRTEVVIDEMAFHLPLDFLDNKVDTYINLAKIKTHMEATVGFSLKNQMALPAPGDRVMMHKTDLEKTIAKLSLHCKPDLNILEGFPAMENNGPHHGTPRGLNLIAIGTNMVELDSFVATLLGYDSEKIKHIKYAEELGTGKVFNKEKLPEFEKFFVKDFKRASQVYNFGKRFFVYPTYSCSRCINAVNLAGNEVKKHPLKYWRVLLAALFSKKKVNIVFGKADNLDISEGNFICIGSCSKNFANKKNVDCLDKCPPSIEEARNYIINNIKD